MSAVSAILAALFARERTGDGASIDISMFDAALYWMMLPAARELVTGGAEAVGELPTFGDHACYNVYETRDGRHLALGALEPKFWEAFCDAVGRPDLIARQHTHGADQENVIADVQAIFRTQTAEEWLQAFDRNAVCLSPVNRPAEVVADPHVTARGLMVAGEHGVRAIRSPFVAHPARLTPAPEIGAHTAELLADLQIPR